MVDRRCRSCGFVCDIKWKLVPCKHQNRCYRKNCSFLHDNERNNLLCRICTNKSHGISRYGNSFRDSNRDIHRSRSDRLVQIRPPKYVEYRGQEQDIERYRREQISRRRTSVKRKREDDNSSRFNQNNRKRIRNTDVDLHSKNIIDNRKSFSDIGEDINDLLVSIRKSRAKSDYDTVGSLLSILFRKLNTAKSIKSTVHIRKSKENPNTVRSELGIVSSQTDRFIEEIKASMRQYIESSNSDDISDYTCGKSDPDIVFLIDGDQFPRNKDIAFNLIKKYSDKYGCTDLSVKLFKQCMEDNSLEVQHQFLIRQCEKDSIGIDITNVPRRIPKSYVNRALSAGIPMSDIEPIREVVDYCMINNFRNTFSKNTNAHYVMVTTDSTMIATILAMSIAIKGHTRDISNLYCHNRLIPRWIKRLPGYVGYNTNEI